ncbi:tunicamycin resistance ATP-binding TmrB [soil metagenome]
MVIWINGAFGVGKTTAAEHLVQRIAGSRLVDPERIGYLMRRTLWRSVDYQEVSLWRRLTARRIASAAKKGTVIVPMTVVNRAVFDEITRHARVFALVACRETIEDRIAAGDEAHEWRRQNLDRCLAALEDAAFGEHITTDGCTPGEVADLILARL